LEPYRNPCDDSERFGNTAGSEASEEKKNRALDEPRSEDKKDLNGQNEFPLDCEQGEIDIPNMYPTVVPVCSYERSALDRLEYRTILLHGTSIANAMTNGY
jgi:hypothetical protein